MSNGAPQFQVAKVRTLPSVVREGTMYIVGEDDNLQLVLGCTGPEPRALGTVVPYVHTQSSASNAWLINHNLSRKPGVEVYTSGGVQTEGVVVHLNDNQTQISFSLPLAGYARLT